MMRYTTILTAVALLPLACADIPEAPEVAGVNVAYADFHPETEGTVVLRVSVSDRYGFPWLDMPTTRVYVRQLLTSGVALRSIAEPESDDGAQCGWVRPVEAPSAVAVVMDRSGLSDDLESRSIVRGVLEAFKSSPDDMRFSIIDVGTTASLNQPLTSDHGALEVSLRQPTTSPGAAALFDGITLGVQSVSDGVEPGEQAAVVVVTSSLDTVAGTEASFASVTSAAREAGVPVYFIAYGDATKGIDSDLWALDDVAIQSGGRFLDGAEPIYSGNSIGSVFSSIRSAYDVCVEALPVDSGNRYAEARDMSEISVTVESMGSDLDTVRPF